MSQELVRELIKLTDSDQLKWKRPLLNIHRAERNGWQFYTEISKDDRPVLEIYNPNGKKVVIQAYGFGIKELNAAIDNQYQRLGLYEYSVEYRGGLKRLAEKRLAENKQQADDLAELTKQFKKESGN